MKPSEVTPDNLHIAVAVLLDRQSTFFEKFTTHDKRFDAQDLVLAEIRTQTIKTNGGLIQAKADIVDLKAGVESAVKSACPGKCIPLEAKVRAIEDKILVNAGRAEGVIFSGRAIWWLIGGSAATIVAAIKYLGL